MKLTETWYSYLVQHNKQATKSLPSCDKSVLIFRPANFILMYTNFVWLTAIVMFYYFETKITATIDERSASYIWNTISPLSTVFAEHFLIFFIILQPSEYFHPFQLEMTNSFGTLDWRRTRIVRDRWCWISNATMQTGLYDWDSLARCFFDMLRIYGQRFRFTLTFIVRISGIGFCIKRDMFEIRVSVMLIGVSILLAIDRV